MSCADKFGAFGDMACPFTSDTITGVTSAGGNGGVDEIFLDVESYSSNEGIYGVAACAEGYNLNSGSCGPNALANSSMHLGANDILIKPWIGTGSQYDYFWVHAWFGGQYTTAPAFHGIGVTGVD